MGWFSGVISGTIIPARQIPPKRRQKSLMTKIYPSSSINSIDPMNPKNSPNPYYFDDYGLFFAAVRGKPATRLTDMILLECRYENGP